MPSTMRTRSRSAATAGRFGRPPGGTAGRRAAVPTRYGVAGGWLQRRRPPKQSAVKRALNGVSGALPTAASKRPAPATRGGRRGKVGGLALLAGAAGLIFKNRDKVASMARRHSGPPTHQ